MDDCEHEPHEHSLVGGHQHLPQNFTSAFAIGLALNLTFVTVEAAYGWAINSISLMADAGHNLGDVLGLVLAWLAAHYSQKQASDKFSYGYKSSSIMAALVNSALLMLAVGAIFAESVRRLLHPEPPLTGVTMMIVAAIGVLINGVTALLFFRANQADLNIRATFLHMVADAVVSAGVILTGLVYLKTGWNWIDPVSSIVIGFVIARSSFGVLKESFGLALQGVPKSVDLPEVREFLLALEGVNDVDDLHIWAMSTTEIALTCHLVIDDPIAFCGARLSEISDALESQFHIGHTTIQIERA